MKDQLADRVVTMVTTVPSDADLWRRLAQTDEAAFRELFVRHRDAVYNYCFRRTSSWSSAEDATQATFTALWRRAVAGRVDQLRIDSARPALLAMARDECSNSRAQSSSPTRARRPGQADLPRAQR